MNAADTAARSATHGLRDRIEALDWASLLGQLDGEGHALTGPLLAPEECAALTALYADDTRFRKRIVMERYRYGVGDYAYFAHPLPPVVATLRETLYGRLAPLANGWAARLARSGAPQLPYPATLAAYLERCHAAGQQRPTPLLLRYAAGGYNCLHQDLYGSEAFPVQATCFLSRAGTDYRGGEFLLVEQRPRQQSRGTALSPVQGAVLLFASAARPVPGKRGVLRAHMRHGVSTVSGGNRFTLGIIFHDAA